FAAAVLGVDVLPLNGTLEYRYFYESLLQVGVVRIEQFQVKEKIEVFLLNVWQKVDVKRDQIIGIAAFGEDFVFAVIGMQSQGHLFDIVRALRPSGRGADLLHRRHQKGDQNSDDCDDDEKLDQRERGATAPARNGVQHDGLSPAGELSLPCSRLLAGC